MPDRPAERLSPAAGADPLAHLGLPADTCERLRRYLTTLDTWGRRVNLTGARTAQERVRILIEPVLAAAPLIAGADVLDIGSGNGSPGLILALVRPELRVRLLEPRRRRWAFLREAARAAGVAVEVLPVRHEDCPGPPAGTVTLRALVVPPERLRQLVAPGGRVLLFGQRSTGAPGLEPEGELAPEIWGLRRST